MAKVAPTLNNFNTGEVSPLVQARTDIDRLKAAVSLLQNYIPTVQGGATKRPGTKFVGTCDQVSLEGVNRGVTPILVGFEFSNTQAYIIEFNNEVNTIRFYKNRAQILSGSSAYQITNPYIGNISSTELIQDRMQFFQSNDVLYITHPNLPPKKLIRLADDSWRLDTIAFEDGPYLPVFIPSLANPAINVVGSANQYGTVTVHAFLTSITSVATTGTNYRVTTGSAHYLNSGDKVAIDGVASGVSPMALDINNTAILSNYHTVATVSSTQFDIRGFSGTQSSGYVSAGSVYWTPFGRFDSGRMMRINKATSTPSVWTWGTLSLGSASHPGKYNLVIQGTTALGSAAATTYPEFRIGVWRNGASGSYSESSFPATATIHENRLTFYGATLDPSRVDMSNSDDYENFSPTDPDGLVPDSRSISFPLASNGVQVGTWIASDERGLLAGSEGQEWMVRPSYQQEALTPTNITAKPTSSFGALSGVGAVRVGKSVLFIQRAGRRLMEYSYYYDVDGFDCEDVTVFAEHISLTGIKKIIHQKQPQPVLWALRNDGVLLGMTYKKSKELASFGWHRHPVGGYCNANGDPAKVLSIACIPSPDGTSEDLYMAVQRWVNGAAVCHLEYMTQPFDDSVDIEDAFFLDCGLTYDPGKLISSISSISTNSVLMGVTSHGYSNGDRIRVNGVIGLPGLNYVGTSANDYLVSAASTNTFVLQTTGTVNVTYGTLSNSGSLSYIGTSGSTSKYASSITGLGHLEGQAVDVFANGQVVTGLTVTGSAVTITGSASKAHVGLNYTSRIKTLRFDAGAIDGTSIGKFQRSANVTVVVDNQGTGLKLGRDFNNLLDLELEAEDAPLFSGIKYQSFEDDYSLDNRVCVEHSKPTPSTILGIMPDLVTTDG